MSHNEKPATDPKEKEKQYHVHVIYNHDNHYREEESDRELSLKFVEFLVSILNGWGYTKCYYYDEDTLPGTDVFDELFRVVNGSEWTFVILTEGFVKNGWVKYCQKASFKNLLDQNKKEKLIPIVVGKVGEVNVPTELNLNNLLVFKKDPKTWEEDHKRELKRLHKVMDEKISVVDSGKTVADSNKCGLVQEESGEIRSENNQVITTPESSMHESHSNTKLDKGIVTTQTSIHSFNKQDTEIDGFRSFDNLDGPVQHSAADDGIGGINQNADRNLGRKSDRHNPQNTLAQSATTATVSNIQGEQRQFGADSKLCTEIIYNRDLPASTSTQTSNYNCNYQQENERTPPKLEQSVGAMSTNASVKSTNLPLPDSAFQSNTSLEQKDQTEPSSQVPSPTREATKLGQTIKMEQVNDSHRKLSNSSEGQSRPSSFGKSDIHVMINQDSGDELTEVKFINTQCAVNKSVAGDSSHGPDLSCFKTVKDKDVNILSYEVENPEQRMKDLKFDHGSQDLPMLSLSDDLDLDLDQELPNLQCEANRGTLMPFEPDGQSLNPESLNNTGSMEQRELTEPKHLTSISDAGYVSADNISSNRTENHSRVHTDNGEGMHMKPSCEESESETQQGYSSNGDVRAGNNQVNIVRGKESKPEEVTDNKNKDDTPVRGERPKPIGSEADIIIIKKESESKTQQGYSSDGDVMPGNNQVNIVRGKESKPEEVTDNKNKDDTPVRGERPKPIGSEADILFPTAFFKAIPEAVTNAPNAAALATAGSTAAINPDLSVSMKPTSRTGARNIAGYGEIIVSSLIHSLFKTDMLLLGPK